MEEENFLFHFVPEWLILPYCGYDVRTAECELYKKKGWVCVTLWQVYSSDATWLVGGIVKMASMG